MATLEELVEAVVERLEERGTGQPIAAEDAAKVRKAIPYVLADLFERRVVLNQIFPEQINDAQFLHLRSFIAWKVSGDFGAAGDSVLAAEAAKAESDLQTLSRISRGTRKTLGVDPGLRTQRPRSYFRISN